MRHKQYFITFDSDLKICGSYNRQGGNASTISTAKRMIAKLKKDLVESNPRNFKVYDCWADVDPETNFVPCVYQD